MNDSTRPAGLSGHSKEREVSLTNKFEIELLDVLDRLDDVRNDLRDLLITAATEGRTDVHDDEGVMADYIASVHETADDKFPHPADGAVFKKESEPLIGPAR